MIKQIISFWKRLTCRHEVDKLRFVRMIHGDEINQLNGKRFEYQCAKCGKMVYKEGAITCEGCAYLNMWNNGKTVCERGREMEKNCLYGKYRWWWKESKAERYLWWEKDKCLK